MYKYRYISVHLFTLLLFIAWGGSWYRVNHRMVPWRWGLRLETLLKAHGYVTVLRVGLKLVIFRSRAK